MPTGRVAGEQEVLEKGLLSKKADLYSFALIMWSLVAGKVRGRPAGRCARRACCTGRLPCCSPQRVARLLKAACAGQEPWEGESPGAIYVAVCREGARPPVPADCPEPLAALMAECWAADPAARPAFSAVQARLQAQFRAMLRRCQMQKATST